jgi:hypothetical protein
VREGAFQRLFQLPWLLDRHGFASEAFGYPGNVEPRQVQAAHAVRDPGRGGERLEDRVL